MGKTRLALQCSLLAAGLFGKHLYYAKLDAISDELLRSGEAKRNFLAERIGEALKLSGEPVTHENLPARLPTETTLLVLDNFESVDSDESAELLFTLLENRPQLHLLVTGRESVKADDTEKALEIEGLTDEEARDLLIARIQMQAVRHQWKPTPYDEVVIPQLLPLTECIPLALELAAAQAGHMELSEITVSLEKEPLGPMAAMPEGHRRGDRSERHRSLTRSLNWSYKLLRTADQAALACLGLFGAPFIREEVQGCFPTLPPGSLQRLQEAAILRRRGQDGQSIYSLLRPTRSYALDRLEEHPDAITLRKVFIA